MKLVGKEHPGRAIAFLDETYPPGSDTGMDMLSHQGEEAGMLVEGRLELTVNGQVYVLESGDSYYFESRSEEHTSELQSLMRISYAVFCLKKKKTTTTNPQQRMKHIRQQLSLTNS